MELMAMMTLIPPTQRRSKRKRKRSIIQRTRMPDLLRSSKLWRTFVQGRQEEALLGRLHQCGNQSQGRRRSRRIRYPARKTVTWSLAKRNLEQVPFMSVMAFRDL